MKALLYPGAIANGLFTNMTIPRWNNLFNMYNLTEAKNASAVVDLQRLEVSSTFILGMNNLVLNVALV